MLLILLSLACGGSGHGKAQSDNPSLNNEISLSSKVEFEDHSDSGKQRNASKDTTFSLSESGTYNYEEPIPANSKILFLGIAAEEYKNCFMGIYENDSTVNMLNLTTDHFNTDDILKDFYVDRESQEIKNSLLLKLDEGFDCIVYLPDSEDSQLRPEIVTESTRLLKQYTASIGSKILLTMVWGSGVAITESHIFEEHAYRIADAHSLACIPAGLSWKAALEDQEVNVDDCSPHAPNNHAEYVLAATVYSHLFKQSANATTYIHDLGLEEKNALVSHSYSTWESARSTEHYEGDYLGSFCKPWEVPHDLGNRTWLSLGSSTERFTGNALKRIIKNAGYDPTPGMNINNYFGYALENTSWKRDIVREENFDFLFGRHNYTDYTNSMELLHELDSDEGGDTQVIFFTKHYTKAEYLTVRTSYYWSSRIIDIAKNHPDIQGIPNYMGFGRAWQERPDLNLVRNDDVHLSDLGSLFQAAMIYTLVTGEHPASDYIGWTSDELYVLNMGYKMVLEQAGLKHVNVSPIASDSHLITDLKTVTDTPITRKLEGFDLDGRDLSVVIVEEPLSGRVDLNGMEMTYTPSTGFNGTDTIVYRVFNGILDSQDVTITIDVNDFPLVQEAEDAYLYGSFISESDSAASGGQYVHVPNGGKDNSFLEHKVEFYFNVETAGIYRIKGWVHCANAGDDSFFVKVNGSPSAGHTWDALVNSSYSEDYVSSRGGADPIEVSLEKGFSTLEFLLREDGARLDKVELELVEAFEVLSIEAEDAIINGLWEITPDSNASGEALVTTPDNKTAFHSPNENSITFNFYVTTAGNYSLKGMVLPPNGGSNSCWVQVNGQEAIYWNTKRSTTLVSDYVRNWGTDPLVFSLAAGEHQVVISMREDGWGIDHLELEVFIPEILKIEAEDAALNGFWEITPDSNASGEALVSVPDNRRVFRSPNENSVTFNFNVKTPGNYIIKGRIIAPNGNSDSCWVQVNEQDAVYWSTARSSTLVSDYVRSSETDPLVFSLVEGEHQVVISIREDGWSLDNLELELID